MATTTQLSVVSLEAGETLTSADAMKFVRLDAGRVKKVSASTQVCVGWLPDNPETSRGVSAKAGDVVRVALLNSPGIGKIKAQTTFSAGAILVSHTDGRAKSVANLGAIPTDSNGVGVALEAATAAGQVVEFLPLSLGKTD